MKTKIIMSLLTLFLVSCNGNYKNVILQGKVVDINENPISNAKVEVICWVYNTDVWESIPIKQHTTTDKLGKFSLAFIESELLEIEVTHNDFQKQNKAIKLKKNTVKTKIVMEQ